MIYFWIFSCNHLHFQMSHCCICQLNLIFFFFLNLFPVLASWLLVSFMGVKNRPIITFRFPLPLMHWVPFVVPQTVEALAVTWWQGWWCSLLFHQVKGSPETQDSGPLWHPLTEAGGKFLTQGCKPLYWIMCPPPKTNKHKQKIQLLSVLFCLCTVIFQRPSFQSCVIKICLYYDFLKLVFTCEVLNDSGLHLCHSTNIYHKHLLC